MAKEGHKVADGSRHITCAALAMGPIYENATHKFYGEAIPGTPLTDANWRVSRITIIGKRIMWADGDGRFDNVFTDLATVAALSYT